MNRRSLISLIGSLPIVGAFVKPADGVALRSTSHPIGPETPWVEPNESSIVSDEISLTLYASAGEQVTCDNGHLICEFVQDVSVGQMQDLGTQLGRWTQPIPQVGQIEMPVCVLCGGMFYEAGGVFHFRDGWRTGTHRGLRLLR